MQNNSNEQQWPQQQPGVQSSLASASIPPSTVSANIPLAGVRPTPVSPTIPVSGWHSSPLFQESDVPQRVHAVHSPASVVQQPSIAEQRSYMGMLGLHYYRHHGRPLQEGYQLSTVLQNRVAQHGNGSGFVGAHHVHTNHALAMDSAPNSFTSIQGEMKTMSRPEPAVDRFQGSEVVNSSVHMMASGGMPQESQAQTQVTQPGPQQWVQQGSMQPPGTSAGVHVPQQQRHQPGNQQPHIQIHFHGVQPAEGGDMSYAPFTTP
jgi:hypothetical protein